MQAAIRFTTALAAVLALAAPAAAQAVRVGIYTGPGIDAEDAAQLIAAIPAVGLSVTRVEAATVAAFAELDVFVVGGGSGTKVAKGLVGAGAEALAEFVASGGGYVGLGAGAYLAARGYNAATRAVELVGARLIDQKGWKRGAGDVVLEALSGPALPERWAFQNGPLFAPARSHGAPSYEARARFVTDLHAGDEKKAGFMPQCHAILRANVGQGRAVLFSVLAHRRADTVPALVDAICWASGDGDAAAAAQAAPPAGALKVAVLDDEGCIDGCVSRSFACLDAWEGRFWVRRVSGRQVGEGVLEGYDVVLLPGGSATSQSGALGDAGRRALKAFVAQGGGYVGVCAGAYLAASEPRRYGLGLVAARVVDTKNWKRGEGIVDLEGTAALGRLDPGRVGEMKMLYANGPLLEAMDVEGLPDVDVLARFRSDMHKNGAPAGVMPGKLASLSADFEQGRVILFSTHPELTKGFGDLLARAALWSARRDAK